jgi:hypothetical protein
MYYSSDRAHLNYLGSEKTNTLAVLCVLSWTFAAQRRSIAMRANVARIRVAARNEPLTVPAILEWPPARLR